jgi:hypothetical protein
MSGIDIFAWVVLLIMIASVVVVFVVLGMLPGKVARQRQHPQAQAIQVSSWLALIFGCAAWPFVVVWAYLRAERLFNRVNLHQSLGGSFENVDRSLSTSAEDL